MPFDFSAAALNETEIEPRNGIDYGTAWAWLLGITVPWTVILAFAHWLLQHL